MRLVIPCNRMVALIRFRGVRSGVTSGAAEEEAAAVVSCFGEDATSGVTTTRMVLVRLVLDLMERTTLIGSGLCDAAEFRCSLILVAGGDVGFGINLWVMGTVVVVVIILVGSGCIGPSVAAEIG